MRALQWQSQEPLGAASAATFLGRLNHGRSVWSKARGHAARGAAGGSRLSSAGGRETAARRVAVLPASRERVRGSATGERAGGETRPYLERCRSWPADSRGAVCCSEHGVCRRGAPGSGVSCDVKGERRKWPGSNPPGGLSRGSETYICINKLKNKNKM
ncbi:Protein of unknown function [Gryllus bimaculatus]|nr:Protein of unknown function [Gryllus bimaculatus]